MSQSSTVFTDTKPHYLILDGMRGVAALMVLIYHLFEGFATSPSNQICNHGYLAVPLFFVLSGFVIGYAYDDRWKKMSTADFFKRRLIRLHPMVVLGAILGFIAFIAQGSVTWKGEHIPTLYVVFACLFTLFMIPVAPSARLEVRGYGELFPLNGPYWSLLMEYIGNILYALLLRKLSNKMLATVVILSGLGVALYAVGNGSGVYNLGVGWTMANGFHYAGFLVMLYSYSVGMLMARTYRYIQVRRSFWSFAFIIVILTAMPYVVYGGSAIWNGVYDAICVLVFFPLIVYGGASASVNGKITTKICQTIGDISYPVYAIHYPSMYLFYAWVWGSNVSLAKALPVGVSIIIANIVLAYVFLRIYDLPVRRFLASKLLRK